MSHNRQQWEKFISQTPSKAHTQSVLDTVSKEMRQSKKSKSSFNLLAMPWIPALGVLALFILSLNFIPSGILAPQFVEDNNNDLIEDIEDDLELLEDLELIELLDLLEGWDES